MEKRREIILSLLLTVSILYIKADSCSSFATDSLEKRVEAMEQKTSFLETLVSKLPHISGYIQTGYNYNSAGNGLSTFQVKRLRLSLDGKITDAASYKLQFEAFSGINVGSRWEKQKIIQILDAYAQYRFCSAFTIRVGQFSTPIGYENYDISPLSNVTVDYASICNRIVLRNAVGYNYIDFGRDIGVMLMGDFGRSENDSYSHFSYNLAITNGHLPTVNDNNKSKDLIVALTYRPIKEWNFKAGYNIGEYTPDTFSGNTDTNITPWLNVKGEKYIPMHRIVVGTWYNNPNGWYIRTEYGHQTSCKRGVNLVNEDAFYFIAAYNFKKWVPVIRYDFFVDNILKSSVENRHRGLIGCSYIANSHIKIQFNYILSRYNRAAVESRSIGGKYSNEILLMGLFSF